MRRTKVILSFVSIAVLFWVVGCYTLHKSDLATLQGTWKGHEIAGNTEGSRYLIISGNAIEFQGVNSDDWCKGTFTIREDTNPRQIVGTVTECHMHKYVGKTAYAIYRLEGDTLTVTGYEPGTPNVPSDFDAPGARHFVLKRD
ncbi:MAG: hypothetical protein ABSD77_02625 [Verrucomicrobiota bacterium]|jgi:uncharacterized protein (TIGR03067 family)